MKILAIDTATEACSVAIYIASVPENDPSNEQALIDSIFEICPQQHSQQILPMIDQLLTRNNISVTDLDAIAYGRGPGSFTGVRIAASTVQGLALGANLPVIQVSTLAAMAQQNFAQHGAYESLVLIDARMQEVYLGHYSINNGIAEQQLPEAVVSPQQAFEYLSQLSAQCMGAGTGFEAYAELFSKKLKGRAIKVEYPNAAYMLPEAIHEYKQGKYIPVEQIEPVYVRDTVTWQKLPHKR